MMILNFIAIILSCFAISGSAHTPRWSTIEYNHSSGPVSPEYQYNYSVVINEDGSSKLIYTNQAGTKEYDFTIPNTKRGMKKLRKELKKSKVFDIDPEDMKSDDMLLGGKTSRLSVTLWQDPGLDQPPRKIEVPSNLNEQCRQRMERLYTTIMNLIPASVKSEAGLK